MPTDQSPNLTLPYILAAQSQKHVTHNEAIRALDALVQLAVLDRNLAAPPGSPADGARYIIAAAPSGEWAGHAGKIAARQDGAWEIYTPREGWVAWVADEDVLVVWNGTSWVTAGGGGATALNPAAGGLVGVNTTADATNRLAVASPSSLFNHAGAGHQQKINKAAAGDTASQLYQTAFSGRAEIGLTGDDNFHFKVSPDGASWKEAILVDRSTGVVTLPFTALGVRPNLWINGGFALNQRGFSFGALADGAYGIDRWKGVGATNIGWDAATQTVTLNAGAIRQVVEPLVWGYSNLATFQVTVSVEGLTGGNLAVQVGSASGVITPGSGRRSVTLTLGAGDTGNLACTLTPSSYPTWWKRAKLEVGDAATDWQPRALPDELRLAQRYYQKSARLATTPGEGNSYTLDCYFGPGVGVVAGVAMYASPVQFATPMRTTPTLTFLRSSLGTIAGRWQIYIGGAWVDATSMSTGNLTEQGFCAAPFHGSIVAGTGYNCTGGWTASAEL